MASHGMAPAQQRIEPSFDLSGGPWLGQAGGQPPPAPSFSLERSHGLGLWWVGGGLSPPRGQLRHRLLHANTIWS